jgi:DNA-binding CsgD family transcriptional regulator/tetratricopeptide (TPR) repeat protein
VYRNSAASDRHAAHRALAAATDPEVDPDRRAWHRAHAAAVPDEEVAGELVHRANRAQRRGGIAAAAAFLERAVALTPDPGERAARALAAARAKFAAGDLAAAEGLLATAGAGPLDDVGRAQVEHVTAQIAFAMRRGRDAPPLLLRAAQRLEPLDSELAAETYLEALLAAIYAGRLAGAGDLAGIAAAGRAAPAGPSPAPAGRLLLLGLATRLTDGYAAAAPALAEALRVHQREEPRLDWLSVAYLIAAQDLWDDRAWFELASRQAELARATGTLSLLPWALDYLAGNHIQAGELSVAAGLLTEALGLDTGIRAEGLSYLPLLLAAWRGREATVLELVEAMTRGAHSRGEGCAITVAEYATAVLYNGLGRYELALPAARSAIASADVVTSSWALQELVEAAARSGLVDVARAAVDRLAEHTGASGTDWATGTEARARALVAEGPAAEDLHRRAVDLLGRTRMAAQLARARLSYGEWLRREGRRVDAREQLRDAHEAFAAMGADGFAERARHELLATGEKVRRRTGEARDELTPQEEHIVRLALKGRTNPEIGAELFISPRTVEWHLRKVFAKLGVSSRKDLRDALPARERQATPV